jgi:hypothetical protein
MSKLRKIAAIVVMCLGAAAVAAFQQGGQFGPPPSGATSAAAIVALFSGCSGTQYLGADGACHTAGTGTVTSSAGAASLVPVFSSSSNLTAYPDVGNGAFSFDGFNLNIPDTGSIGNATDAAQIGFSASGVSISNPAIVNCISGASCYMSLQAADLSSLLVGVSSAGGLTASAFDFPSADGGAASGGTGMLLGSVTGVPAENKTYWATAGQFPAGTDIGTSDSGSPGCTFQTLGFLCTSTALTASATPAAGVTAFGISAPAGQAGTGSNIQGGTGNNVLIAAGAGGASTGNAANSNGGNITLNTGVAGSGGSGGGGVVGNVVIVHGGLKLPAGSSVFSQDTGAPAVNFNTNALQLTGFLQSTSNRVALTADWTCGTGGTVSSCVSPGQIVGTSGSSALTLTLPLLALSWHWQCDGVVAEATGATANTWSFQTGSNAPTNMAAEFFQATGVSAVAAGATTGVSSTSTTAIGGNWTPGGAGAKLAFHISGTIEGASASGTTISLIVTDPTVGDLLTVYRGTACSVSSF